MQERQIENAQEAEDFLREKYTKRQLYDWMVSQLGTVHREAYKLAFDLARQAERAYQLERAEPTKKFIDFGSWDGLHQGLLAGERLGRDLRRLEAEHLAKDKRDLELTRHISLAELDPIALLRLRETGSCLVSIPESLFDSDTPGHYLRRIRNLSLTIPSVTGPYTPVRCTMTLLSSKVRLTPATSAELSRSDVSVQAIVTSHARDDAGVFELDPRDDRYLPFEGAGVIADLRLDLPTELRAFDYHTIQDVVVHVRYTARDGSSARDGSDTFAQKALEGARTKLTTTTGAAPLATLVSVKNEVADGWHRLLHFPDGATEVTIEVPLLRERFASFTDKDVRLLGAELVAIVARPDQYPSSPLTVAITPPGGASAMHSLVKSPSLVGDQPHAAIAFSAKPGTLSITVSRTHLNTLAAPLVVDDGGVKRLNESYLRDLVLVVRYALLEPA